MKYKDKDGKPSTHQDKRPRVVPMAILVVALFGLSLYLRGIFCSEKDNFTTVEVKDEVPSTKSTSVVAPLQIKEVSFIDCGLEYQDYTPCTDPKGHKEWVTEVNVLGIVEHPNLVKLIGYCAEDDERNLVTFIMAK